MTSNPLQDSIGFVKLVDRMQEDTTLKIANSARISYHKRKVTADDADRGLVNFLWKNGHTSPFRHTYYTFHIKAPLCVFRQWWKYQVGSGWREYEVEGQSVSVEAFDVMLDIDKGCTWNEVSGRYVELEPEFYIPKTFRSNAGHANKQASSELPPDFGHEPYRLWMIGTCDSAYRRYQMMVQHGIAKEIARMILPQNIYSEAYWTVSHHALLHFLEERTKPEAQWEIRQYALEIAELIKDGKTF